MARTARPAAHKKTIIRIAWFRRRRPSGRHWDWLRSLIVYRQPCVHFITARQESRTVISMPSIFPFVNKNTRANRTGDAPRVAIVQ